MCASSFTYLHYGETQEKTRTVFFHVVFKAEPKLNEFSILTKRHRSMLLLSLFCLSSYSTFITGKKLK
jgi:hypothetical protein